MIIERIETMYYKHEAAPQLFVSVFTDEGLIGLGETWYGLPVEPVESTIKHTLTPLLIGEDSGRIEFLWQKMYRHAYRYGTEGIVSCAISGIDLALWDLLGKRLDVPVAVLLGGTVRDGLKAYASLPPLPSKELILNQIEKAVEAGFTGAKIHELEPGLIKRIRDAVPADFSIMLDSAGHWNPVEAVENINKLEEYQLTWIEEPIWPMQDHQAMARVRERVNVNFAAGENEFSLSSLNRLMETGAVSYLQPEVAKIGGLSMARKISALAELHNQIICPHSYRTGPASYASIHWAMSHQNMGWLEIPWLPEGYEFPAKIPGPPLVEGKILLPEGPGFGVPES